MGINDDSKVEQDSNEEAMIARSTVESDLLELLPKANEILPRSATKKEEPLFAIGHQQIKIGELDGFSPEQEVLWAFSKTQVCESPTRAPHRFLRAKTVTQPLAAHKLSAIPSLTHNPLSNYQGNSSKRIQPASLVPQKTQGTQQLQFVQAPSTVTETLGEFLELSSLVDQYTLIYSKFNPLTYDSFNTLRCSQEDLHNAKKINFLEDTLFSSSPLKRDDQYDLKSGQKAQSKQRGTYPIGDNRDQEQQSNQNGKRESRNKIRFESRFECGNLSMAFERSPRNYVLLMQNDINTYGCTQWFYFRIENGKTTGKIEFEIANFHKSSSLFAQGMKVLVYSSKKRYGNGSQQLGWHRDGFDIAYGPNSYSRNRKNANQIGQQTYFSLKFAYDFEEENDSVYFAYNYPYSYSRLQDELHSIRLCPRKSPFFKQSLLCRTLAGNRVDLLTITDSKESTKIKKSTIVISARVHPGETVSSFMMKGFIDALLEDTQEAHFLRKHFVFKIIPMMNPDGVIHGNYRCSLSGKDLNRQWKKPAQGIFPEIYALKRLILKTQNLVLFCDLHGHSIKKNIFVYGCHDNSKPTACRELPYILSKIYEPFSFKDCNFNIKAQKEGTARVALWNRLRLPNIFTLESSFCGPSYNDIHFGIPDFERMGKALCSAFLIYFDIEIPVIEPPKESPTKENDSLGKPMKQQQQQPPPKLKFSKKELQKELLNNKELLVMGLDESAGSDSCPSEDDFDASQSTLSQSPTVPAQSKRLIESPSPLKKAMLRSQRLKPFVKVLPSQQSLLKDYKSLEPATSALVIPPTKDGSMLRILENNVYSLKEYDEAQKNNSSSLSSRIFTLNFIGGNASNREQQSQDQQQQQPINPLSNESPDQTKGKERRFLQGKSNQQSPIKSQNSYIATSKYAVEGCYYPMSVGLKTGDQSQSKFKNNNSQNNFVQDEHYQNYLKKQLAFDPYRIKAGTGGGEEKIMEGGNNIVRAKKIIEILRPHPSRDDSGGQNRIKSEQLQSSEGEEKLGIRARIPSNDMIMLPQIQSKFHLNYIPSNSNNMNSKRMELLSKQMNNSIDQTEMDRFASIESKGGMSSGSDSEMNDLLSKKRWSVHQIGEPKSFNSRKHSQQLDGGGIQSSHNEYVYSLRRREINNQTPDMNEEKKRLGYVSSAIEKTAIQVSVQMQAQTQMRAMQKHADIQLPGLVGEQKSRNSGSSSIGIKESEQDFKSMLESNWSQNSYGPSQLAMVNEKSSRNSSYSRSSSIKKKIKAVVSTSVSAAQQAAQENPIGSYDIRISKMKHNGRSVSSNKSSFIPSDDDYILTNFI